MPQTRPLLSKECSSSSMDAILRNSGLERDVAAGDLNPDEATSFYPILLLHTASLILVLQSNVEAAMLVGRSFRFTWKVECMRYQTRSRI
jgi:hypothetical protein